MKPITIPQSWLADLIIEPGTIDGSVTTLQRSLYAPNRNDIQHECLGDVAAAYIQIAIEANTLSKDQRKKLLALLKSKS